MPIWQKVPSYPVLQSQRNSFWRSAQVPSFTHGLEAHSLMSSPQVVPEKPGLHKQWVPPPSNSLHSPFPWHVCPVHSGISIYKNKQKAMCQPQGWYCKIGTPPWALDSPRIRGGAHIRPISHPCDMGIQTVLTWAGAKGGPFWPAPWDASCVITYLLYCWVICECKVTGLSTGE